MLVSARCLRRIWPHAAQKSTLTALQMDRNSDFRPSSSTASTAPTTAASQPTGLPSSADDFATKLMQLVRDRHKEEAAKLVEHVTKESIPLDFDQIYHAAVRESKLHINAFAFVMAAHPNAFAPRLRLEALRGCLGSKNYRGAIRLFEGLEDLMIPPSELNKPLLQLLRDMADRPPEELKGLRNAQYLVTDYVMFRNAAKTNIETLLETVQACNASILPSCIKLLVYSSFGAPQAEWATKLDHVKAMLSFCLKHSIALPDTWCFTTAFLKANVASLPALEFSKLYLDMVEANLIQPSMEASWPSLQVVVNEEAPELVQPSIRTLMAGNMTRQMYHFGLFWCLEAGDGGLAKQLFAKLTASPSIAPNGKTLSLIVPLLEGAPADQIHAVLAYFAKFNVFPTREEYMALFNDGRQVV
ncbi:unnamed protein product [Aphanomyces euteiches]